jgi:hypothetical protein
MRRTDPSTAELDCRQIGSTMVLSRRHGPSRHAAELAGMLPRDPGRSVVVVDTAAGEDNAFWSAAVTRLRRKGPLRLALSGAGSGEWNARAQWLAEQLHTEVLAPDGMLVAVPGGSTFVVGTRGIGSWRRFRARHQPEILGKRFPVPDWEQATPAVPTPCGGGGIAEPIPAGLWLHAKPFSPEDPRRRHARVVFGLPCQQDVLTIVVGGPEEPTPHFDQVRALLAELPGSARSKVRVVPYGASYGKEALGQLAADALSDQVLAYAGLPFAGDGDTIDVVAMDSQGQPTWRPFATELSYWPRRSVEFGVPTVVGYRRPVAGMPESRPGQFDLGNGLVAELVQAGLWVREQHEPPAAAQVRAVPLDPAWTTVTVGVPGTETPSWLVAAATRFVDRLDVGARRLARIVIMDESSHLPVARSSVTTRSRTVTEAAAPAPVKQPEVEVEEFRGEDSERTQMVRMPATTFVQPRAEESEPPAAVQEEAPGLEVTAVATATATAGAPTPSPKEPAAQSAVEPARESASVLAGPGPDQHRDGAAMERALLRQSLGPRYEAYAADVRRGIGELPGLHPAVGETFDDVIVDLVAVQVYLSSPERAVDLALRGGQLGAMGPYVGRVVSGMRRLPSYRGPVLCGGTLGGQREAYQAGRLLTEPALVTATTMLDAQVPGDVEFLIWSLTGRRTGALEPRREWGGGRVVFLPESHFLVLAAMPTAGPLRVLLAEVGGARVADGPQVMPTERDRETLAKLADAADRRDTVPAARRVQLPDPTFLDQAIGVV